MFTGRYFGARFFGHRHFGQRPAVAEPVDAVTHFGRRYFGACYFGRYFGPVPFDSGFYIDGRTEARITEPYGSLTLYSDGEGGFFSIE